jgi:hypothetical protein
VFATAVLLTPFALVSSLWPSPTERCPNVIVKKQMMITICAKTKSAVILSPRLQVFLPSPLSLWSVLLPGYGHSGVLIFILQGLFANLPVTLAPVSFTSRWLVRNRFDIFTGDGFECLFCIFCCWIQWVRHHPVPQSSGRRVPGRVRSHSFPST